MSTQDFNLDVVKVEAKFTDYEKGMAYARQTGKPVLLDFTGFGCVNCRKMETAVWRDARVRDLINKDYVLISLYVDDKTALPAPIEVEEMVRSPRSALWVTVGAISNATSLVRMLNPSTLPSMVKVSP